MANELYERLEHTMLYERLEYIVLYWRVYSTVAYHEMRYHLLDFIC